MPAELILLPRWFAFNVYAMSAWSRTIFVPLSVVDAFKPVTQLPDTLGIRELFLAPPETPRCSRRRSRGLGFRPEGARVLNPGAALSVCYAPEERCAVVSNRRHKPTGVFDFSLVHADMYTPSRESLCGAG